MTSSIRGEKRERNLSAHNAYKMQAYKFRFMLFFQVQDHWWAVAEERKSIALYEKRVTMISTIMQE